MPRLFLERFGLHRKALPLSEQPAQPASPGRRWGVRGLLFGALVALTVLAFPERERFTFNVNVGDLWREETLRAPFDFAVRKTAETMEEERQRIRDETPPYFREERDAARLIRERRDTVAAQLQSIAELYAAAREAELRGSPSARDYRRRAESLRSEAGVSFSTSQWELLLDDYLADVPGLAPPGTPARRGPPLFERLLDRAYRFALQITTPTANMRGVLDTPIDSIRTDAIIIRDPAERLDVDTPRFREDFLGINDAYDASRGTLARDLPDAPQEVAVGVEFFRAIMQPNYVYLLGDTEREIQSKINRLSPATGAVMQDEVIVRQGDVVTDEVQRKLKSLMSELDERGGARLLARRVAGQVLLSCAILFLFFLYLYLLRRQIFDDDKLLVLTTLVLGIIIGLFAVAVRLEEIAAYAVPVAVASVLLTVLFDSRVGVFGTLSLALIGGHLIGDDLAFTFATLFACTIVVFSMRDIKNRGQIFLAAGMLVGAYVVVLATMQLLLGISPQGFARDLVMVLINAFLLLFAYPLLWVFERLFGVTTDLTLLELSNTNRPLLRELSKRAPGTFNHVLQVANLAEACADAIGANALLTRVGALYHDVGKMKRPEYFVENQRTGDNPHDRIPPALSAAYIVEHVTEGLKIARRNRLPEEVVQFIHTHHGTTRIEYFYRKAVDARSNDASAVDESAFRYPGPRPQARETAILMLADSTEAASRAIDDPTPENLVRLVDGILKARVNDEQFARSDLTFADLTIIRETLLKMLISINHSRIKYPEPVAEAEAASQVVDGKLVEAAPPAPHPADTQIGAPDQSKSEQDMK